MRALRPALIPRSPRALTFACGICVAMTFEWLFRPYFPTLKGEIAGDYAYYFPSLFDGALWFKQNGFLAIPWFSPSFCGGIPAYPNPQSAFYALPQLLDLTFGPMTAVHATAVLFAWTGYAGFYVLLREAFRCGRVVSVFGGGLFALDGFYLWRMVAGHLSFHPFALVPLVAWAALRPLPAVGRLRALACDACVAGAAIAYSLHAGAVQVAAPSALAVIAIAAVGGVAKGTGWDGARAFAARFAGGTAIGLALAAGKLASALAFLSHAPRALYPLPAVRTAGDLTELLVVPLLSRPRMNHLGGALVNTQFRWAMSEFELGVGAMPFLLLACGLVVGTVAAGLRVHRLGVTASEWRGVACRGAWAVGLAVLLALPLYVNVYNPPLGALLKTLPVLKSMHSLFRFLSIYVPVLILAGALVLDRVRDARLQALVAAAGIALLVRSDREAYPEYGGGYSPGPLVLAHQELAQGATFPAIQRLAPVVENTGPELPAGQLAGGVSTYPCYEPMFGYNLEAFPPNALREGPVTDVTDHAYNLLDPSCFLYPDENGCKPGDRLSESAPARFEGFRSHLPISFVRPWRQHVADAVGVAALLLLASALFGFAVRGRSAA